MKNRMGLPRQVFFETLTEIGKEDESIIVLDADVARSTGSEIFRRAFPDRFISVGVAEQNMLGVSAGISLTGKKPYASAFAVFAVERTFEIIRNTIAYSNLNVKIIATHAGIGVGPDGASHQANEDIGLMCLLPNMTIVVPSDATMAKAVAHVSVKHQGPMYIRFGRSAVPDLPEIKNFKIGKTILRCHGSDIGIISYGAIVSEVIESAQELAREGISISLLECPTIKPLDTNAIIELAKSVKLLISIEEHSVIGGLGSAVAECISNESHIPLFLMGIPDEFSESGTMDELLEKYCLKGDRLINRIREIYMTFKRKREFLDDCRKDRERKG